MLSFHLSINVIIIVVSFKILDLWPIALFQQLWNTLYCIKVCVHKTWLILAPICMGKCHDIWDRINRTCSFETTSFETTIIWDHVLLRPVHLRPHSHETFSFETTFIRDFFIWNHVQSWLHSFEITFISHHVEEKLFWCTVNHIVMIYLSFTCGRPVVLQRDSSFDVLQGYALPSLRWLTLRCKCAPTLKHRRGQKTLHTSRLEGSAAPLKVILLDQAKQLDVLRSFPFPLSRHCINFSF